MLNGPSYRQSESWNTLLIEPFRGLNRGAIDRCSTALPVRPWKRHYFRMNRILILMVARWITDHYHLSSNLGCFIKFTLLLSLILLLLLLQLLLPHLNDKQCQQIMFHYCFLYNCWHYVYILYYDTNYLNQLLVLSFVILDRKRFVDVISY